MRLVPSLSPSGLYLPRPPGGFVFNPKAFFGSSGTGLLLDWNFGLASSVTVDGSNNISAIADQSGQGNNGSQATANLRHNYSGGAAVFTTSTSLSCINAITPSNISMFVQFGAQPSLGTLGSFIGQGSALGFGNDSYGMDIASGVQNIDFSDGGTHFSASAPSTGSWPTVERVWHGTYGTVGGKLLAQAWAEGQLVATRTGTSGDGVIDVFTPNFTLGKRETHGGTANTVKRVILIGHDVSTVVAEQDYVMRGLGARAGQIVLDGNSWTDVNTSKGLWPKLMPNTLARPYVGTIRGQTGQTGTNIAVSGITTTQLLNGGTASGGTRNAFAVDVAPKYRPNLPFNILFYWECRNDLAATQDPAGCLARIVQYGQLAKAAGFKVIAVTCPPTGAATAYGGFEADRQTINTGMRAQAASFCHLLVDLAVSVPTIDIAGSPENNPSLWDADHVHFSASGAALLNTAFSTACNSLIPA